MARLRSIGQMICLPEGVEESIFSLLIYGAFGGLRALFENASQGKRLPNFIVADQALKTKMLSLNLTDAPLTQAIEYVARIVGASAAYDQHGVIFSPAGG